MKTEITRRQAPRKRGNHVIQGSFVKINSNEKSKDFHLKDNIDNLELIDKSLINKNIYGEFDPGSE